MSSKILYEIEGDHPIYVSSEGDLLDTDFDVSFEDDFISLDRSNLRCVCCNSVSSHDLEDEDSPFTTDSFYLVKDEVLCYTCISYSNEALSELEE